MQTVAEFKRKREIEQKVRILCRELSGCPPIDSTKDVPTEKIKLFAEIRCFRAFWQWYIAEIDPQTGRCYGFVRGLVDDWGYFMLGEIIESHHLEYRRLDLIKTVDEILAESDEVVTPCYDHPTRFILCDGFFTAGYLRAIFTEAIHNGEKSIATGTLLAHPRVEKRYK